MHSRKDSTLNASYKDKLSSLIIFQATQHAILCNLIANRFRIYLESRMLLSSSYKTIFTKCITSRWWEIFYFNIYSSKLISLIKINSFFFKWDYNRYIYIYCTKLIYMCTSIALLLYLIKSKFGLHAFILQ